MVLARQTSYDKKTLARQVIPLALGCGSAVLSCPELGIKFLLRTLNFSKVFIEN